MVEQVSALPMKTCKSDVYVDMVPVALDLLELHVGGLLRCRTMVEGRVLLSGTFRGTITAVRPLKASPPLVRVYVQLDRKGTRMCQV